MLKSQGKVVKNKRLKIKSKYGSINLLNESQNQRNIKINHSFEA